MFENILTFELKTDIVIYSWLDYLKYVYLKRKIEIYPAKDKSHQPHR